MIIVYVIGVIGLVAWIVGFAATVYYVGAEWVDRRDV